MSVSFILASASPRRLALLAQIGLVPKSVEPADIDETSLKGELPRDYARRLARAKAEAVAARFKDMVLAADTVVSCGRRILPKAEDDASARKCLELLSGRRHKVITAFALARGKDVRVADVMTVVQFKRLTAAEIDAYIAAGEWRGKAGGYAIQGSAAAFIPAINGSYSNVVGLPLAEVKRMLSSAKDC